MTREELIKKTEQLCDLYLELKKEGVFGIIYSLCKIEIQCLGHTLKKFAGDTPTKTRKPITKIKDYPTETFVEFDKFTAFTLNELDEGEESKITREELIRKTEQLCDLYLELEKEGVFGITNWLGKTRIQCFSHNTLKKFAGDIPIETRKLSIENYPTETFVKLDKFTAFTLNEEEEQ